MSSPLVRKTLGNAGALVAGSGFEAVLQFAFLLMVSRQLGPEDYGFYEYLVGIVTLLVAVVQWGLHAVVVRELAQTPERLSVVFAGMFRIRAVLAAVAFVGGVIAAFVGSTSPDRAMATVLLFLYLVFLPFENAAVFDAHKLSRWDVPGRVIGRLLSVMLLFLLWRADGTLTVVDAALCASLNLAINVVVSWQIARRVGIPLQFSWLRDATGAVAAETRRLVKRAAPIAWTNLMATVYTFAQPVLVKWYSTDLQTGWFGLANRLLFPMTLLKGLLYRLMLPILSEVSTEPERFEWRFGRILTALSLFFMPVVALAIPAIELLVVPVFGSEYSGSVRPLQILFGHLFITGAGSVFGTALFSLGFQKAYAWSITVAFVVNLVVAAILIPRMGALGAAWAVVAAELTAVAITIPAFRKVAKITVWGRVGRIALICLAALAVYFVLTRGLGVNAFAAFGLEVIALTALLWLGGELSRERLQGIVDLVRKKQI